MEDKIKLIEETITTILKMLQIEASVKVETTEGGFQAAIETSESGLLIGHHGVGLNALQFITANIIYKQTGAWEKIVVDVGGYRDKRAQSLKAMAHEYAQKVVETGEPMVLPELSSFERRLVHVELKDNPEVVTESEGEGKERKLVIKPKAKP